MIASKVQIKGIVTIANPTHKDIFLEPFYSLLEKPGQCIANPIQNDIDLTKPNMLALKKDIFDTQCRNIRIRLPVRFYVKSILANASKIIF